MTVNSRCALLFLVLFIDSVCAHPYSCISTAECAERHAVHGTEEVLFHCEGKRTICCPPGKSSPRPEETVQNKHTSTERGAVGGCRQCSYESNRPDNVAMGVNPMRKEPGVQIPQEQSQNFSATEYHVSEVGGGHNAQAQPEETKPAMPEQSNMGRLPQVQPPEGRRPPQSHQHYPQTTSDIPQSLYSLSSHRNFRLLPPETQCGVNSFANRITEGEEVLLGEYPWMALTGLKDKFGNYRWNCGGTLINEWYVLTAAHCLVVDNRVIEYVRLGEHSLLNETDCNREMCTDPPEDIRIAEAIPHELWNTTTIKNDIALLRLSRNPLKLGKSNIYPICLPLDREKLNLTASTKYEVAGWGKTDWNADEGSDVLRKATISGVNREECNICKDKKKQQYCPIADTQLCVQGWKSVDVCKGDSGGPLMVTRLNIYQIGITSFKGSEYCGAENIPSIFTKIESYLPWILDNIRE